MHECSERAGLILSNFAHGGAYSTLSAAFEAEFANRITLLLHKITRLVCLIRSMSHGNACMAKTNTLKLVRTVRTVGVSQSSTSGCSVL